MKVGYVLSRTAEEPRVKSLAQRIVVWIETETGASLVEYALLVALIAVAAFAAVAFFGVSVGSSVDDSASKIDSAVNN